MAYFTPGILELIESLVHPSKYQQDSVAWSLPVHGAKGRSFVGMPYWQLAAELLAEGALPLGVYRRGGDTRSGNPLPYGEEPPFFPLR